MITPSDSLKTNPNQTQYKPNFQPLTAAMAAAICVSLGKREGGDICRPFEKSRIVARIEPQPRDEFFQAGLYGC